MAHPRMYDESNPLIRRLREMCLSFSGTFEKEAWGECTFRVSGGGMFAMTDNNHHSSGHLAVWVKAPPLVQEFLVKSDATRFFVPPYMGSKGWVGVRLDDSVNWDKLGGILADGYRMSAPKQLRSVDNVRSAAKRLPGTQSAKTKPSNRKPIASAKAGPKQKPQHD
jgi:predicted DNA-binding protein (MmcQ/YjbR family)